LGRVERRDAGAVEHLASCPNRLAAHPASEDWLAFRVPDRGELSRRLGWVRHRLWRQQDEQPVDVIVPGTDLDDLAVALGRGIAEDVDWVGVAPERRQHRIERGRRLGTPFGELSAVR